ncbi:hypothetical protein ACERIT_13135 [Halopenitus sp. H-Gu1]|uniref:DUF7544 domain-containing protein n=1 Tax=Halopenitus sp. H-Gu1 TaxID=3242697 RepID=UPI00359D7446
MALHAVDDIDDAYEATRSFLVPIQARRWLKLALVAFFIGGGMNVPTAQFNTSSGTGPTGTPPAEIPPMLSDNLVPIIAIVGVTILVLVLAFGLIGAIMEFVFIESLRREAVSIREYWSDRWPQGLRLFGFRILIGLPVLGFILGWMALFFAPMVLGVGEPLISVAVLFVGFAFLFVIGLLFGLVNGFTTVFVVPIMIQQDSGVVAGWRRLWESIKTDWKQYLVYAVLAVVLNMVTGLIAMFATGMVALVLLVPLALLAGIIHLTVSVGSTIGMAILAVFVLLFVLVMMVVWALVQVPILAYLRYYALLVLGDIDESLDLIPEQRSAIRSSDPSHG